MYSTLALLIDRLDRQELAGSDVIQWGAPVPAFGDPARSQVATLGLNPSNREFVDGRGIELNGEERRFHTLNSLNLTSWSDADSNHLNLIEKSCVDYFVGNPYDRWFRVLDRVISATGASFYDSECPACHLDLIPFATIKKWTELTSVQRALLLEVAGDTFGILLRESSAKVLILNGRSVVGYFQAVTGIELAQSEMPGWSLPRRSGTNVPGIAYWGEVDAVAGWDIGRKILVLGYNHNLQSSFGVTNAVIHAIRDWILFKVQEGSNGTWGQPSQSKD